MALKMRLQLKGCNNRPFFNIVVARNLSKKERDPNFIEQLGYYDPLQNTSGMKVVGLDIRRIRYWLGSGAELTPGVAHLLGLAGITPVYPPSLALAKKRRERRVEMEKKQEVREREKKAKEEMEREKKEKAENELGKVESEGDNTEPNSETAKNSNPDKLL